MKNLLFLIPLFVFGVARTCLAEKTNDLLPDYAALAIQHDLLLYSRDAHFDNLPQIARIE